MYIRRIKSRRSVCFQIGYKYRGRFVLVKHVGCAVSPAVIPAVELKAKVELRRQIFRHQLPLFPPETVPKAKLVGWRITGYRLVFGKIYDSIGFPANMLKDLVIARIVHPKSKLSTINYLRRFLGISLSIDKVYRFLDTLDKDSLTRIAFKFVSGKHRGISLVFYDVTSLHFETETEDWWRRKGYSKNHRADVPQIIIGLFVDAAGYPFDFDMFSGNTFEGHTFETAVSRLIRKYDFSGLTVVADAAMLSKDNLAFLESKGLNYVVGARLKSLPEDMIAAVTGFDFSAGAIYSSVMAPGRRLLVDFSAARAKRDAANRDRQVRKLKLALANNRQVIRKSKYLRVDSPNQIQGVDQAKIAADAKFDGLKGYVTNQQDPASFPQAISQYRNLWKIERAFRMSKTDLKQRPVYHRLRQRIQSHLLVCFCSLLVMKQAETILAKVQMSLKTAIETLGEVGEGTITIGRTEFPVEKELNQDAKLILNLFKGH
jgi:transposase